MGNFDNVIVAPDKQLSEEQLGYLRTVIQELRRPNENYGVGIGKLRTYHENETIPTVCAMGLIADVVAPHGWYRAAHAETLKRVWVHFGQSHRPTDDLIDAAGVNFPYLRPAHSPDLCDSETEDPICYCSYLSKINDEFGEEGWAIIADCLEALLVEQTKNVPVLAEQTENVPVLV